MIRIGYDKNHRIGMFREELIQNRTEHKFISTICIQSPWS